MSKSTLTKQEIIESGWTESWKDDHYVLEGRKSVVMEYYRSGETKIVKYDNDDWPETLFYGSLMNLEDLKVVMRLTKIDKR